MSDLRLAVSGVSKRFCRDLRRSLGYGVRDIVAEFGVGAAGAPGLRPGEFWALRDIGFELRGGEALAVLGHNGAGKSTLLRLLSGMIKPDSGEIRSFGRVEALVELGAGFDPRLTGRENVLVGAALRGLSAARARGLLDEVVEFAELAGFIDAPLQSYSSGMRARLGFAVAALQRPDLFLVDEVLAVGDRRFKQKCVDYLRDYIDDGGALLLVSHNLRQVRLVCGKAILLRHGRIDLAGDVSVVIDRLLDRRPGPEPIGDADLPPDAAEEPPAWPRATSAP